MEAILSGAQLPGDLGAVLEAGGRFSLEGLREDGTRWSLGCTQHLLCMIEIWSLSVFTLLVSRFNQLHPSAQQLCSEEAGRIQLVVAAHEFKSGCQRVMFMGMRTSTNIGLPHPQAMVSDWSADLPVTMEELEEGRAALQVSFPT